MSTTRIIAAVMLIAASGLTLHATQAQLAGTRRIDLQRHDLSAPGREVVQARVEIDPGVTSSRHSHPGEEIIYVLEGVLEYQRDGKPPVTLKAGDVLFIPAGTIHAAKNVGSGPGAELATYVVEKGKPLVTVVE
jgi:quercetin dioxygenase-like cupin family protein